MAPNGALQSPADRCRNNRIVGYQGESSRSTNQRQSGDAHSATQTGTPSAPARCAVAVSDVMTKSRFFITAAVSMNAPLVFVQVRSKVFRRETIGRGGQLVLRRFLQADQAYAVRPWPAARTATAESSGCDRTHIADCLARRCRPENPAGPPVCRSTVGPALARPPDKACRRLQPLERHAQHAGQIEQWQVHVERRQFVHPRQIRRRCPTAFSKGTSAGCASNRTRPPNLRTSLKNRTNIIVSPSPCSAWTSSVRPASGEPSHNGLPNTRGRKCWHLSRQANSGQPSANFPWLRYNNARL